MDGNNIYTIKQTAARLGITPGRVYQLAQGGQLPGAQKPGKYWQVPADSHPELAARREGHRDELAGITAARRDEAVRRLGIIDQFKQFAAACKNAGKIQAEALKLYANRSRTPARTMQRWLAAYAAEGIRGLVDKRGRPPRSEETISPEAWEYFKSLYLTLQKKSAKQCLAEINFINKDRQHGWTIPRLAALYRFIDKAIPKPVLVLLRDGLAAYEAKFAPYIVTDPDSISPGQIWVGDHAEFNCWVRYHRRWIRPWVTAWMDMRSRMLVGWHISASPNQTTILLAAKKAIDKYGLPDSVKIDNGRDYDSQMWTGVTKKQRRALNRGYLDEHWVAGLWGFMNVSVSFAIPYHPQSKGVLERWFDTVDEQFTKSFDTYAGKRSSEKPEDLVDNLKDPRFVAKGVDWEDFQHKFTAYISTYNNSVHTGWGMNATPSEVFARRTYRRVLADGVTDLLMRVWSPELTVGKNGVQFKGLYYGQYDMELAAYKGRRVRCAYDPADMSRVYVYDSLTLKLITIAEQARLIAYGAGVDEESLRNAHTQKTKAVKFLKQFRDTSLTANMDLTDLAIRSREAANAEDRNEITVTQAALRPAQGEMAIRPVVTPLNGQVREHERQETIKAVRRAAGGEAITHVLDIDLTVLRPQKNKNNLKLFDG